MILQHHTPPFSLDKPGLSTRANICDVGPALKPRLDNVIFPSDTSVTSCWTRDLASRSHIRSVEAMRLLCAGMLYKTILLDSFCMTHSLPFFDGRQGTKQAIYRLTNNIYWKFNFANQLEYSSLLMSR